MFGAKIQINSEKDIYNKENIPFYETYKPNHMVANVRS